MSLLQYCVKTFTQDPLQGNPAAVVKLDAPLDKDTMQRVAFINGFPETVYLLERPDQQGHYDIWWFTPTREVVQAGHATLAAQYVLSQFALHGPDCLNLHWYDLDNDLPHSSQFNLARADTLFYGPSAGLRDSPAGAEMLHVPQAHEAGRDLVLLLDCEAAVKAFIPPLERLSTLPYRGLCITAQGDRHDYCARFFAPAYGVAEDNVTASAHHYLAAHWGSVLDKPNLHAVQCSASAGTLAVALTAQGIEIQGRCCLYATSHIHL